MVGTDQRFAALQLGAIWRNPQDGSVADIDFLLFLIGRD
jgi:hypothetical protein